MNQRILSTTFFSILTVWVYLYPYQWWIQYSNLRELAPKSESFNKSHDSDDTLLPKTFWGSSLIKNDESQKAKQNTLSGKNDSRTDVATPMLDEIKACFGSENSISHLKTEKGDFNHFFMSLQNELGPVKEDNILEKKVVLTMKNGNKRTLVYEWISPEDGSDVYWHDLDEEGFPKSIDLPDGTGNDLSSFENLKQYGTPGSLSEVRLILLQSDIQLGVEKSDDIIQNFSLKDEEHIIKCRKDSVKGFVCDCLN